LLSLWWQTHRGRLRKCCKMHQLLETTHGFLQGMPCVAPGKKVQKVKAEGNLFFPQARQIVVQRNTLPISGLISVQVVSAGATNQRQPTVTAPVAKQTVSVEVQTDLTWPAGEEYPQQMPRCSTACQTVSPNRSKSGPQLYPTCTVPNQ